MPWSPNTRPNAASGKTTNLHSKQRKVNSKKQKVLFLLSAICCLLCSVAVFSAEIAPLTWQDCVRLAARNNPDLISSLRAMEASRAQYKGSYNGILPKVSLSNTYTDTSGAVSGVTKPWQAQGTASLDLVDFGQWATIQSFSASLQQSQANLEVAGTTALLNLYKAFAALLYSQEEVQVTTNILDIWKMNAQMINLRYKSGSE